MQRVRVIFKGRVQGVGFRYCVLQASKNFKVVGFVKNLDNGDVELVAEGDLVEIKRFLAEIEHTHHGHIIKTLIDHRPSNGEFVNFEIRQ